MNPKRLPRLSSLLAVAALSLGMSGLSPSVVASASPRLPKPRKLPNVPQSEIESWNAEVENRKRLKRERKGRK